MILKNVDLNKEYTIEELTKIIYQTIYELNVFLQSIDKNKGVK